MTSRFALAGLGVVCALALAAPAHAFIEKVIQQRTPGDIDPKLFGSLGGEQKGFLTAAQLRCTLRGVKETVVMHLVFQDPTGKSPNFKLDAGGDIVTGPIANLRTEDGERRFRLTVDKSVADFVLKSDGSIAIAAAYRDGERRDYNISGTCEVASGEIAEPRRESTPPAPKPAPRGPRAALLTAPQLSCTLNHGDHDHRIVVVFRNGRSFFYEPARTGRDGFTGLVRGDRADDEARTFTIAFKDGLEIDYTLTAGGRLTATGARRDGRTGTASLHGTCTIDTESAGG